MCYKLRGRQRGGWNMIGNRDGEKRRDNKEESDKRRLELTHRVVEAYKLAKSTRTPVSSDVTLPNTV